jgi:hypothetical protein
LSASYAAYILSRTARGLTKQVAGVVLGPQPS